MNHRLARFVTTGLMILLFAASARALESTPVRSARAIVSLVSDTDAISPNTEFGVGLYIRLAPGWHTYWRNPGDAGVAPELTFAPVSGMTEGPITWPTPDRIAEGSLTTFSYRGDVLLPVRMKSTTAPLLLKAHASWFGLP